MQTIQQLSDQLKLTPDQKIGVETYCSQLALELLESIKQDNVQNFDETISTISSQVETQNSK